MLSSQYRNHTYQDRETRVASKVDNRLFKIRLYFRRWLSPLNSAYNFKWSRNNQETTINRWTTNIWKLIVPVTLMRLWKPKKTTGWRGVSARWTSVSMEIRSDLFSGECSTRVCSVSKSQDRMVQSFQKIKTRDVMFKDKIRVTLKSHQPRSVNT